MSTSTQPSPPRTERDSIGERQVPGDAYYGIQTLRAVENFPISGWKPFPSFINATIKVKKAAVRTNRALGALDGRIAGAIETVLTFFLFFDIYTHYVALIAAFHLFVAAAATYKVTKKWIWVIGGIEYCVFWMFACLALALLTWPK